jgi:serine/threonine-protein kinase
MKPQESLGKYMLRGTLGRGAMGTVYDGWDPLIDRRVAIKTVKLADADDEETAEALARFKREAQAAGRLSHPNIVGVYDYGETDELAYIVMEFVEGRSLKSLLDQEKRLPPDEACTIMQQVLAGLGYSHARGVVHRDIKPANIMLTSDGQVKIADFGIARIESSSMTSVGTVMGTPAYMPPEQFLGEPVDARSDIYAAGVMLFHLLTGERPYEGNMTTIMQKVLSPEPAPPASARVAALPAVFDAVIAGAMAKAPGNRYPSAGAFAQALRAALEAAPAEAEEDATIVAASPRPRPAAVPEPPAGTAQPPAQAPLPVPELRQTKRAFPVALVAGMAAVVIAAAGGTWFVLRPKAPEPAPVVAPVTPPPTQAGPPPEPPPAAAAKPTAEQMLAKLQAALPALSCTALSASRDASGGIVVSGLAGAGDAEQQTHQAVDRAAGAPVTWNAQSVPATYCPALDDVRSANLLQSGGAAASMTLTMNDLAGHIHLVNKAPIAPQIGLPNFPAWLTVDYLANDGSMLHAYPNARRRSSLQKPGAVLALPASEVGTVGPPFGTDLIIAIAAAKPLLPTPRPKDETTAHYLAALAAALTAAHDNGIATEGAALVVDTTER